MWKNAQINFIDLNPPWSVTPTQVLAPSAIHLKTLGLVFSFDSNMRQGVYQSRMDRRLAR